MSLEDNYLTTLKILTIGKFIYTIFQFRIKNNTNFLGESGVGKSRYHYQIDILIESENYLSLKF